MSDRRVKFSVFTKPWTMPLPELAGFINTLGLDGIELPVRPGFQVEPENVSEVLPKAVSQLADRGIRVFSIAGPTDEHTMAACREAGVRLIRIMLPIDGDEPYQAAEDRYAAELDALAPLLEKHGVTLAVQAHCGRFVCNAAGLRHLIGKYDPKQIGAVLDPGHCAHSGEMPALALDILWSHLCMVNLKNGVWKRTSEPDAPVAAWQWRWTSGREGVADWAGWAAQLEKRGYDGVLCFGVGYRDKAATDTLIVDDIAFAKSLFL